MAKREMRSFGGEEKFKILCEHIFQDVPVSGLCEKHKIQPSQFYAWQKQLMDNGSMALERKKSEHNESLRVRRLTEQLERLKSQVQEKNNVLAELMHEHITLKKNLNGEN